MAEKHVPQMRIKLEGPAVGPARLAARDLAKLAQKTEQALKRIAQVLYGQSSGGRGRKKKDIEDLCALYLVSWDEGSAIAGFDFAETPQITLFGNLGEQSLEVFLAGLAELSGEGDAAASASVPTAFDLGVLETCEAYGNLLDHGIDRISFSAPRSATPRAVAYTAQTREAIRTVLRRPLEAGRTAKVGRLEVLNGHDAVTGRLWEADGTRWTCHFKSEHLDVLPDAWLKTVTVVGEATLDEKSRTGAIAVDAILLQEGLPPDLTEGAREGLFWTSASLEDLATDQDVGPLARLDDLAGEWPTDDLPDDPLADLLLDRKERRRASRNALM